MAVRNYNLTGLQTHCDHLEACPWDTSFALSLWTGRAVFSDAPKRSAPQAELLELRRPITFVFEPARPVRFAAADPFDADI